MKTGGFAVYCHYAGGLYLKLCEARHTETDEPLVVYVSAATGEVWARPKAMFAGVLGAADHPEKRGGRVGQPRFTLVSSG